MIDKSKTYKTRDGREVRIYATDGASDYVHGAILWPEGWVSTSWTALGRQAPQIKDGDLDLIEVKPRIKRTVWLNMYDDDTQAYPNKGLASCNYTSDHNGSRRIACIKVEIDCEEGEGLND